MNSGRASGPNFGVAAKQALKWQQLLSKFLYARVTKNGSLP